MLSKQTRQLRAVLLMGAQASRQMGYRVGDSGKGLHLHQGFRG